MQKIGAIAHLLYIVNKINRNIGQKLSLMTQFLDSKHSVSKACSTLNILGCMYAIFVDFWHISFLPPLSLSLSRARALSKPYAWYVFIWHIQIRKIKLGLVVLKSYSLTAITDYICKRTPLWSWFAYAIMEANITHFYVLILFVCHCKYPAQAFLLVFCIRRTKLEEGSCADKNEILCFR